MLKTPLHQFHVDHGAKMVEFAGWEMPLVYKPGITAEHHQVRRSGGIFDVSHMGRLWIKGRHARRWLERACTRRIADMQAGQCRYSLMCNDRGGVRDDVLVYRMADDEFMVVCNASNRDKIVAHLHEIQGDLTAKLDDRTLKTAMIAVQGPKVMDVFAKFSKEIPTLKRYRFTEKNFLVMKVLVSRTGYTGEDGVEVILPANMVGVALKMVLKDIDMSADDAVIRPAGLGARDTLRTEAGMPLYGHELGEDINALSCGVDFAINLDKDEDELGEKFVGADALKRTRDAGGPPRTLVGLDVEGKRTPRQGMTVMRGGKAVGVITSGCMSPTFERPIAMALIDREAGAPGTDLLVDSGRDATFACRTRPLPFYKLSKG